MPHIRALDGLRGLAVLLVVASHFLPSAAPGGFLGVDLFFVLSGFLITSLLVLEHEGSARISLRTFWTRRVRRLLPALLLLLVVAGAVQLLVGDHASVHRFGADGLASLFYVANWRFIASGQSYVMHFVANEPSPLRHMWSLAIEEQFYLLWPLVVVAATLASRRMRHPRALRRVLVAVCTALGAVSIGLMVTGPARGVDLDRLYYGTDTRVFMILLGCTIGAWSAGRPILRGWGRVAVVGVGAVAAAGLVAATLTVETTDRWLYAGGLPVLGLAMCALLVAAAQPGRNPVAGLLGTRPLVALGAVSYGVYLWHWPISLWVDEERFGVGGATLLLLRIGLTAAAAVFSYRVVELPIRKHGLAVFGRWRPLVAPFAVVSTAVLLLVPVVAFPAIPPAPDGPAPVAADTAGYAAAPRCDVPSTGGTLEPGRELTFQLIGNSLAGEVRSCLTDIMEQRGARHETVNPPGFLLCHEAPAIEAQARDEATRPDFAVLFVFVAYDDRCGEPWHRTVDELIDTWLSTGTHVFLVPSVRIPSGGREDLQPGVDLEDAYYRERAAADPDRITYVDAGRFMRDAKGVYSWRMPCASSDEPGCREDGTVPVRFVDGLHFCTDADFPTRGCVREEAAAGERRVASAIAARVVDTWQGRLDGLPPTPVTPPSSG